MRSKFDCLFDRRSGESPRLDILMTEMSGVIVCSPQDAPSRRCLHGFVAQPM